LSLSKVRANERILKEWHKQLNTDSNPQGEKDSGYKKIYHYQAWQGEGENRKQASPISFFETSAFECRYKKQGKEKN
jgi:hypothetical protein